MTPEYAQALGFTKAEYPYGKNEAERGPSQALYDSIDVTLKMNFSIVKEDKESVTVQEPTIKSVSDLISEMNKSLIKYKVVFEYDAVNFTYEDSGRGGTIVILSEFLASLLGIPKGTQFKGPEVSYPTYSTINLGLAPSFHAVTCNIIESQTYNGKLLQVLKLIPFVESQGMYHFKANPVQYVPIASQAFENIRVQMFDENMKYSVLTHETDTTAVLHMRSRF